MSDSPWIFWLLLNFAQRCSLTRRIYMLGEYGIYGQIRAILTAMFNSLMPSLNSRSAFCGIFGWISKQMPKSKQRSYQAGRPLVVKHDLTWRNLAELGGTWRNLELGTWQNLELGGTWIRVSQADAHIKFIFDTAFDDPEWKSIDFGDNLKPKMEQDLWI